MARVLCISSQTVYGPVGNSAAVPALQAEGHEVMQIPTVILSNHPGHGKPSGQSTPVPLIQDMLDTLTRINAFNGLNAVMTGYFTSAAQVIAVAKQIAALKAGHESLHVLVDPVMGDHGALYVPVEVAETIRDQLLPLATITTPNLFELTWLTGIAEVQAAVTQLNVTETIVTSVPLGVDQLTTILHLGTEQKIHIMQRHAHVPHGTGDYLAGCYLANRLKMQAGPAFEVAMTRLETAINKSLGRVVLNLQ
jgi:pyridoxine kinase